MNQSILYSKYKGSKPYLINEIKLCKHGNSITDHGI